jgi:hypothetical protein
LAQPDTLAEQARFVFRGTVEAANASTMPQELAPSNTTCIVHVDEVLQGPQSLAHAAGEQVTLLLSPGEAVANGDHAVFFTNPWLYGDTVAVQSLGHQPSPQTLAQMTRKEGDPARTLTERDRASRAATADIIVRGRVLAVRLVDPEPARTQSEHEPQWQDATVRITAVEKGDTTPGTELTVRFPGSSDIAWRDAPKFTPGQEGRFVLRRPSADSAGTAPELLAAGGDFYTALDRNDFHPAHQLLSNESLPPV